MVKIFNLKAILVLVLLGSIVEYIPAQSTYTLKEIPGDASCFSYDLIDTDGNPVKLPEKFKEVLDCPSLIEIHSNILTYEFEGVRQYNIKTGVDNLLFTNYDDIDGCSGPVWSEDESKVMFVVINQQMTHNYAAMCRIIVLTLDDEGKVIEKLKFDRNVHFSCGSMCYSVPGEDFYFINNSQIAYREHTFEHENFEVKEIKLK